MGARITDPALLERQLLPDAAFRAHWVELIASLPPRAWDAEARARGLRYPWYRPQRSYLLRDLEAIELDALGAVERRAAVERLTADRTALLAIGSNAAPRNLAGKLAHQPAGDERAVLVLAGELHGFDVVAHASVAVYGAMAATLVPSPGTSVRAALLFVTAAQLTVLTWSEMSYRVGRLRGTPFTVEAGAGGPEVVSPLAYVSRWGAFLPDGAPAPLAAIAARERRRRGWTQEELLSRAAELVLGPDGGGPDVLMRAFHADPGTFAARAVHALREHAAPPELPGWVPIAPDGTL